MTAESPSQGVGKWNREDPEANEVHVKVAIVGNLLSPAGDLWETGWDGEKARVFSHQFLCVIGWGLLLGGINLLTVLPCPVHGGACPALQWKLPGSHECKNGEGQQRLPQSPFSGFEIQVALSQVVVPWHRHCYYLLATMMGSRSQPKLDQSQSSCDWHCLEGCAHFWDLEDQAPPIWSGWQPSCTDRGIASLRVKPV